MVPPPRSSAALGGNISLASDQHRQAVVADQRLPHTPLIGSAPWEKNTGRFVFVYSGFSRSIPSLL